MTRPELMGKRGIKVRDLSTELGVTSRQVIDRCRAEGIAVQNSITRLSPDIEKAVRSWFAERAENSEGTTE